MKIETTNRLTSNVFAGAVAMILCWAATVAYPELEIPPYVAIAIGNVVLLPVQIFFKKHGIGTTE